ncbi:MAG: hypothetical protein ACT4QG_13565 [Sporichthyaceae bacterium]
MNFLNEAQRTKHGEIATRLRANCPHLTEETVQRMALVEVLNERGLASPEPLTERLKGWGAMAVLAAIVMAIVGGISAANSSGEDESTYTPPSSTSSYSECVAAGQKLDQALANEGYVIVDQAQHTRAMQEIRDLCRKG